MGETEQAGEDLEDELLELGMELGWETEMQGKQEKKWYTEEMKMKAMKLTSKKLPNSAIGGTIRHHPEQGHSPTRPIRPTMRPHDDEMIV